MIVAIVAIVTVAMVVAMGVATVIVAMVGAMDVATVGAMVVAAAVEAWCRLLRSRPQLPPLLPKPPRSSMDCLA